MIAAGYSPSVRLFEAAACATAIISDIWPGIDEILRDKTEIILARTTEDVLAALERTGHDRAAIGKAARNRFLAAHTAQHRAKELEHYIREASLTAVG
jgi:spore maturation protein CgeB